MLHTFKHNPTAYIPACCTDGMLGAQVIYSIIDGRRRELAGPNPSARKDLLQSLLTAVDEDSGEGREEGKDLNRPDEAPPCPFCTQGRTLNTGFQGRVKDFHRFLSPEEGSLHLSFARRYE